MRVQEKAGLLEMLLSRAVRLAMITLSGEMGYPGVLSAPVGVLRMCYLTARNYLYLKLLEAYVMENILFKISFPAEFHAQTAVEAAVTLHPEV